MDHDSFLYFRCYSHCSHSHCDYVDYYCGGAAIEVTLLTLSQRNAVDDGWVHYSYSQHSTNEDAHGYEAIADGECSMRYGRVVSNSRVEVHKLLANSDLTHLHLMS
jgi:hypothetical protein